MKENNYIFIGSIYPESIMKELTFLNAHVDFAANTFQQALLAGFDALGQKIRIITSPVILPYPRTKRVVFSQFSFTNGSHLETNGCYVGTLALPILGYILEFFKIRKRLKQMLREDAGNIVIVYALHTPFLLAVRSLLNKIDKVCVIVPDLPDYMTNKKGFIHKLAKNIDKKIQATCMKHFGYYALLSPYMSDIINVEGKARIQFEGIYMPMELPKVKKCSKTTILYSGGISERYGVFDLIRAFIMISNQNYELILCGGCDDEIALKRYANADGRIKYLGKLPIVEVRKLQQSVTLLVNPRHSTEIFTKYSFPSKTMEYMASGTPTLMCKLASIPEEYKEHLFFFDDESIEGMKNKIIEICSMHREILYEKGRKASDFILKNKNAEVQAERIVRLLNK